MESQKEEIELPSDTEEGQLEMDPVLPLPEYVTAGSMAVGDESKPAVDVDAACCLCNSKEDAANLVICEKCQRLTHATCMDDMLPEGKVPRGDYLCPSCFPFELPEGQEAFPRGEYLDVADDEELLRYIKSRGAAIVSDRARRRAKLYIWEEEEKHIKTRDGRIVPRKEDRESLVLAAHTKLGHRGSRATVDALRLYYTWKGMREFTQQVISSCSTCKQRAAQPLIDKTLHSIPPQPFCHKFTIDLIGPMIPDKDTNHRYILVGVESLSRWVETESLPDKKSATVARALCHMIFYRYGAPLSLACDRGGEFMGAVQQLCNEHGTKIIRGGPYHPRSQGLVERVNRSLEAALFSYLTDNTRNEWGRYLDQATAAVGRMVRHRSTRMSPYFIMFGRDPPKLVPLPDVTQEDADEEAELEGLAKAELEEDVGTRHALQAASKPVAAENVAIAQSKQGEAYTRRVSKTPAAEEIKQGELVYLARVGKIPKGASSTEGPFTYLGLSTKKSGYARIRHGDGEEEEVAYRRLKKTKID
jgi:hypothetical protein